MPASDDVADAVGNSVGQVNPVPAHAGPEVGSALQRAIGSEGPFHTLVAFAELLAGEGERRGLIGPRELPRLWSRHIVNSLAVNSFVPQGSTVVDVGSGAGFPGVVLAITRPDAHLTLVDSMERRTAWLEHVRASLGLRNVVVVTDRAEALHGRRTFDVVTARAVAPMDRLVRWCLPLARDGGRLLALKGERALEEVSAARAVIRTEGGSGTEIHEVRSPVDGSVTRVVVVMKRHRSR